jgi:hypothetical protein
MGTMQRLWDWKNTPIFQSWVSKYLNVDKTIDGRPMK